MGNEKEKLLFIIPSLLGGGALKTVANISEFLNEWYDVTVIGLFNTEGRYDFKCKTIVFDEPIPKNPIKKLARIIRAIKFVKNFKKAENVKYSISFLRYADLVNIFSKANSFEKNIVSIRNFESVEYKNQPIKSLEEKYCMKKADHIVSISNEVKYDIVNNFGINEDKITTIYNPCMVKYDEKNAHINEECFYPNKTFINVGSLKKQKGQWHLIRAFSEVVKKEKDAQLILLGVGDYEEYLKNLVKEYHIENNVHFLGFIMNPIDYVMKSDVFIFSSIFEGLGNALMEAVACGKAIISTDYSSGAREILAPDTDCTQKIKNKVDYAEFGVLVPVGDEKKYSASEPITIEEKYMSEAMLELINNQELKHEYERKACIRMKDFDITKIVNDWKILIEKFSY